MNGPTVSVIMPAYNCELHIGAAVASVLGQDFTDFELVIVNDGSSDGTERIVRRFRDPRIRVITHPINAGVAAARNTGLAAAEGQFIAWLDADDLASRKRLGSQVRFLERFRSLGMCGTWVQVFGIEESASWRYPKWPAHLRAVMLFDDPFATSSVMLRRAALSDMQFDQALAPAEDYDVWERVSRDWKTANIPLRLTQYRVHPNQTSSAAFQQQRRAIERIQRRQLRCLGIDASPEEWQLHEAVGVFLGNSFSDELLVRCLTWLDSLIDVNQDFRCYEPRAFKSVVEQRKRRLLNRSNARIVRSLAIKAHTAIH